MVLRVMFCLTPVVLSSFSVGVLPVAVMLNVSADDWVMVPVPAKVTLVPAFIAF